LHARSKTILEFDQLLRKYNLPGIDSRNFVHPQTDDAIEQPAFDNYDVLGATRPVERFVDDLSNWYLRRSRRRFWKTESDDDKYAAYATLYEALVTISKLLAPTMPFIAEQIYRNLVLEVDRTAAKSVHISDWPQYSDEVIDKKLMYEMKLVKRLVSLGHAARNKSGVKVRQPLREIAFSLSNVADAEIIADYAYLIKDELNVKTVRALSAITEAVAYEIVPLPKQLGQKYKSKFPQICKAILTLDVEDTATKILNGESVIVALDDEEFEIYADEVEVRMDAKEGFAVASEGALLAALVTELDQDLIYEGLAREFVRRVQEARKQADFEIDDRIIVYHSCSESLGNAIKKFAEYVKEETLAVELKSEDVPDRLPNLSDTFDNENVTLWIERK